MPKKMDITDKIGEGEETHLKKVRLLNSSE